VPDQPWEMRNECPSSGIFLKSDGSSYVKGGNINYIYIYLDLFKDTLISTHSKLKSPNHPHIETRSSFRTFFFFFGDESVKCLSVIQETHLPHVNGDLTALSHDSWCIVSGHPFF